MKLTLLEWNQALQHAEHLCSDFRRKGIPIRAREYRVYDGRRGISVQTYDWRGETYAEFFSGIHENIAALIQNIDLCVIRAVNTASPT